jgi:hypothetical protein
MSTKIYLSRKLESVVSKCLVNTGEEGTDHPLGKWTATLFYVSHKKCLLITNSLTRYSIIVDRVVTADFANISDRFAITLYDQLLIDEIKTDWPTIHQLVGRVDLFSTDNDRKLIGTQNNLLYILDYWKQEFGAIENWPFREINGRINGMPQKELGWQFPKEKMKIVLDDIV